VSFIAVSTGEVGGTCGRSWSPHQLISLPANHAYLKTLYYPNQNSQEKKSKKHENARARLFKELLSFS